MTDSEYLLSMLDYTFAAVPEIKAHHERMRSIAARVSTHPLTAAVPQQEADLSAVQQSRCPLCHAAFPCQHSLTSTTAGWANTTQVSPPQALVPLTLEQVWNNKEIMSLIAEIGFPMPFLMRTVRAIERAHGIGLETKE